MSVMVMRIDPDSWDSRIYDRRCGCGCGRRRGRGGG